MQLPSPRPVVHLELHTGDPARASAFYADLLGRRRQLIQAGRGSDHARQLGASVLLAPREGPAGWRSVISAPQCGEFALRQPKR